MLRLALLGTLVLAVGCSSATANGDSGIDVGGSAIDAHCSGPCPCGEPCPCFRDASVACPPDSGSALDAAPTDAGSAVDSASAIDSAPVDSSSAVDAANVDATTFCDPTGGGTCSGGLACDCCPVGGILERCICSTTCTSDTECTDPTRPICQHAPGSNGFCAPATLTCCWLCG